MRAIKDNGLPKDVSLLNLKLVTPLPYKVAGIFASVIKSKFPRLVIMDHFAGL